MKKTKTKFILALLVLIGTIISTIPRWIEIYQTATGNVADLDEYLATYMEGNLPEGYYNVTLDASLGNFASQTYEGSSNEDSYYYIAWLNDDSFIAMSVNKENQGIMDSLTQNTWNLLDGSISYDEFAQGEKFTFLGNISPMDSEEERFYRSTLAEIGINDYDYNIRYQSLSVAPSDFVSLMLNLDFNFQSILILVSGCVVIVNGLRLHKDRKQMKSIESSVQDYDPTNVVKRQKVVTGKEAMARISNPYLQKYLKDQKQLTIIGCTIVALCVLIPSGLYAYMKFATPSKSASRVYVMDNSDDYSSVKKKAVGEITISYTPVLVYTANDSSKGDYIIYPENSEEIFIAELEDDEFKKAVDEIRGTGSTTLHGYYRSVPKKARENFVEFYNDYYGGNYDTEDFNRLFGPFCLVVDDNYNGVGIVMDDISTIGAIEIFFMVIALLILFDGVSSLVSFKSEMRYLTDGEYDRFESDFSSPQTKEITKFFYCTDKYILALDTFTRLISYSDILWAYLTIHTQNGKEVRYEIKILDRRKGFFELPSIAAGASNKETINMVLNIIANKNPNARIGYTQENIQAAEQINRQ